MDKIPIARYIDHTLLKPDATEAQIRKLCEEAKQYRFAAVCINPCWVRLCRRLLHDCEVKVCTVVGFPLGANAPAAKAYEARLAVIQGAQEIDMVINIGPLLSGDIDLVREDIREVREAIGRSPILKVIIEACLLTDDQKVAACQCAEWADADFVKTSTGFSTGGATVADVTLMREAVGLGVRVKAAGGIKGLATARAMIAAGAARLGCSAGAAIVEAEQKEQNG